MIATQLLQSVGKSLQNVIPLAARPSTAGGLVKSLASGLHLP
jgi:hypothetical protein